MVSDQRKMGYAGWIGGLLCICLLLPLQAQAFDCMKLYVWNFTTSDREESDITQKLTREFEEQLVNTTCCVCTVLDRRDLDRLLVHKDNERLISSIHGLSSESLENLRTTEANTVIFGEMDDDVQSGQITVTVTLQTFDASKLAMVSATFVRWKVLSPEHRREEMQQLVKKFCEQIQNGNEALEDFEGSRNLTWWSPDPTVFRYEETTEQAYRGHRSLKIVYDKTDTYQFIAAELPPQLRDLSMSRVFHLWVYGRERLLVKFEDGNGKNVDISIQQATNSHGWTRLTYDYAPLKDTLDLKHITQIFFFPAPGNASAQGEFFLDDMATAP